jgi:hypothetical protein
MRRGAAGKLLTRLSDLKNGLIAPRLDDLGPLRRFDVVFVTRRAIAVFDRAGHASATPAKTGDLEQGRKARPSKDEPAGFPISPHRPTRAP